MNYHSFKKNWQPLTNTRRTSDGEEGAEQIATFLANRPTVSENERKTHAPPAPVFVNKTHHNIVMICLE